MAVKKITRRWLFNSFGVIVFIILAVEVAFAFAISYYYYDSVRQTLLTQANLANSIFSQYSEDGSGNFEAQVRDYVAQFSARDRMELMTIDADGGIVYTSSGFAPSDTFLGDYEDALRDEGRVGWYRGTLSGQRVMAVTVLSKVQGRDSLSAVRFVTGLVKVDRQIAVIIGGMLLLGAFILIFVLFSSYYFINSIVNPVGEVGVTARRIAQGDFAARLQKRNNDEIGELCDIINHMASELGVAEKLKNDFISSVSHELRTPLTAIQGWAETMQSDGGEDKQTLQRGMSVIISETGRLSQMVEELLDFSRMESGRLKLVLAKMDVLAELAEAVLMYQERARREGIALDYDDDGSVAPVYGDKNKLRQVFVNIIDNAIKYSDAGGAVTVTSEVLPQSVRIVVSDTGIGISAEDIPRVKEKFFKSNTARRGSGIGMAVADEIMTRHNGSLDIESEYGKGTTVTLTLPLYTKQDDSVAVQ